MLFVNPNNSSRGGDDDYRRAIDRIKKDGTCPFCPEHLAKYHKNPILREGAHWLLTDNMYPYKGAKHHLLLIHKKHVEHPREIQPTAWSELYELVGAAVKERGLEGGAFLMRFGDTDHTGASVSHLHANLVSPDTEDEERKPIFTRIG